LTTAAPGVRGHGDDGVPASRDVAVRAARAASEKQAQDIVVLDVSQVIVITDFFVICSAATQRQAKTLIEAVEDALRELGARPVRREGEDGSGWWLLDYIDVVVHVFGSDEREYYDLERLWRDAPKLEWGGSPEAATGR
jgi:ribosome-associated protein